MTFKQEQEVFPLLLENQREALYSPLKNSQRIKYTCFAVSKNYLIFGATSGGLYVFRRHPYSFFQLIPSKESTITAIAISVSETLVACATNKNVVRIVEVSENYNGKLITRTEDLSDFEITALCWTGESATPTLFIGDGGGRVSYLKLSFLSKNILNISATLFMSLDSKVVQLCCENDLLVVSTLTRCYLCDIIREHYRQIGQQLRDGLYGVTFLKNRKRIFGARPGSRLWEVDLQGNVHSTHQFKRQLAIPPSTFVSLFNEPQMFIGDGCSPASTTSFNFVKLYDLLGRYIVTYNGDAMYVLNTDEVNVLFWSSYFGTIVDVQCILNSVFIWNLKGDLYELVFLPIEKCVLTLYLKGHHDLCVHILYTFREKLLTSSSLHELYPLKELKWSSEKMDEEEVNQKNEMLAEFKEKLRLLASKQMKLRSGIHVVNNQHLSRRLLDDSALNMLRTDAPATLNGSLVLENGEQRKRSNSLPINLKKPTLEDRPPSFTSLSATLHRQQHDTFDSPFTDGELYNSPFVAFASYHILRENFSELSSNFSQIFNDSSRNLKEKWLVLESKITSRAEKTNTSAPRFVVDFTSVQYGDKIFENGYDEPIVEKRKTDFTVAVENSSDELVLLYDRLRNDGCADADLFDALNAVMLLWPEKNTLFVALIVMAPAACKDVFVSRCFAKPFLSAWFDSENFPVTLPSSLRDQYPSMLAHLFDEEELKFDYFLSRILAVFCPLLDARGVLDKIKSFRLPSYYKSFCCVLKHFQRDDPSHYERLEGERIDWPMPVYLNTMLLMISVDRIDVFCEMGVKKRVDAVDVLYMLLHVAQVDSKDDVVVSSSNLKHVWLNYLEKQLCESNVDSLLNANVILLAAHALVSRDNSLHGFSCPNCWFLLPQSRSESSQHKSLKHAILTRLWCILLRSSDTGGLDYSSLLSLRRAINDTCEYRPHIVCYRGIENCQHLICQMFEDCDSKPSSDSMRVLAFNTLCNFCYRIPSLWRYLCTLQSGSRVQLLGLFHFIQLDDVPQLQELYPSSLGEDDAKKIFDCVASLSEGRCLNCGTKVFDTGDHVSWDDMGTFVLHSLGAARTLALLKYYAKSKVNLSIGFYRSALLTSLPSISPEFTSRVISVVSNHCHIDHISSVNFAELRSAYERDNVSRKNNINKIGSTVSDAHHWGSAVQAEKANQAICYCCSLPLFSKSLIKEYNGGITVFSCSHTYHTVCLRNKNCALACIVCDRFLR